MAGSQFPYWMMQNVAAAGAPYANAATGLAGNLAGAGTDAYGMYSQYAPGAMSNAAAQGATAQAAGNQLAGAYDPLRTGAQSVMNTAFDPQQALYARTAQQLQDQTRAALSARGIGMSPYGAGIEAQAMSNFGIDWQNNQLQRQLQGLGGAGSALGQYGAGVTGGQALGMEGAQFPISAMGGLFSNMNSAVTPWQQATTAYLQQQKLAQDAAESQNNMLMSAYGMQNNNDRYGAQRQSSMLGGLGRLAGAGIGGYFGGPMGAAVGSSLF